MHYSRRVASWLYGLSAAFIKKCLAFANLDMISFWLLCWRVLRATAGVKRTNVSEEREGCSHTHKQRQREQESFLEAVAIETSQLLEEMATVTENKMDSGETNGAEKEDVAVDAAADVRGGVIKSVKTEGHYEDLPQDKVENGEPGGIEQQNESKTNMLYSNESSVPESRQGGLNRTESVASSCSDSNSSTGSVRKVELTSKSQDMSDQEEPDHQDPMDEDDKQVAKAAEAQEETMNGTKIEDIRITDVNTNTELTKATEVTGDTNNPRDSEDMEVCDSTGIPVVTDEREITKENEDSQIEKDTQVIAEMQKTEVNEVLETTEESNVIEMVRSKDDIDPNDTTHNQHSTNDLIQKKETDESTLNRLSKEDTLSDISNESVTNLDQDDLSDCLQVEMAIVSSDSESDEKWRAVFSSSINKEEADVFCLDDSHGTKAEETGQGVATEKSNSDFKQESEAAETPYEMLKKSEEPQGLDSEVHFPALVKGCNDVKKPQPGPKLRTKAIHPDKKVPSDFCVIQETKSENVSVEHVDFRVARQQWQKMEEQTKQQVLRPTLRQGTCQGGHSLMYTPVRNIDRTKKESPVENLSLKELSFTQHSPCSEDSGLDDSSYRSPFEEPETPIEKEIRIAMEREESLRRERGLSKSTPESLHTRVRPTTLFQSKTIKTEDRRTMGEAHEESKYMRSPCSKSPSFSVSSSPSTKSPLYHEMAANNVIILEPDPCSTSPRPSPKGPLHSPRVKRFNEWPSEAANVIILETSNLIIRSASEFCLNTAHQEPQESTFLNNPFFKLRSRSTQSLVDQEIKVVKQREEELKRQRAHLYSKEKYDTVVVSPNQMESLCFDKAELPIRCKSSPSSPMKVARKMERSTLSCDYKFSDTFSGVRRKSAMALRWEAGLFANHQQQ